MPPPYWAEALSVATHLLNRCPSSSINDAVPYTRLHHTPPSYDHLRVFGSLCYPNLQATSPHKLAPRSTTCVFLGYPFSHKGYRYLDLSTQRIIISRHVVFGEFSFPFARDAPVPESSLDFLLDDASDIVHCPTNHAAGSTHLSSLPPAAAPSSMDAEQPLPATSPGGRGLVPLSGPASTTGERSPASSAGGTVSVKAAPAPPPSPPAPAGPAAPAHGRFGNVYSRRVNSPVPMRQYGTAARVLQPPAPTPRPMCGASPPPILRRQTRLQSGAIQSVNYRNLSASHKVASPIPTNYRSALADPNWRAAMADEFQALIDNGTWRLVPRPPGANVVTGKWIYKHKYHSDGSLARHKARWVVRGFSQ
jgi:hypothetical protein